MKNLLAIFISLFVFTLTYAQPASHGSFNKGYIVDLKGEKIECEIKTVSYTTIKIKHQNKKKVIKAYQILEYKAGGDYFIVSPLREPDHNSTTLEESSYIFLQVVLSGRINLYAMHYLQNMGNGVAAWGIKYYFKKDDSPIESSKEQRKKNVLFIKAIVADNIELINSIDWEKFGKGIAKGEHDDVYRLIKAYNEDALTRKSNN